MSDHDPSLARIERVALIIWGASMLIALIAFPARVVIGVLGGGLAAAVSYTGLKRGVDTAVDLALAAGRGRERGAQPPPSKAGLVKVFTRYLLIALILFVMIFVFGAQPIALVWGASSLVLAAFAEAVYLIATGGARGSNGETPPPALDR